MVSLYKQWATRNLELELDPLLILPLISLLLTLFIILVLKTSNAFRKQRKAQISHGSQYNTKDICNRHRALMYRQKNNQSTGLEDYYNQEYRTSQTDYEATNTPLNPNENEYQNYEHDLNSECRGLVTIFAFYRTATCDSRNLVTHSLDKLVLDINSKYIKLVEILRVPHLAMYSELPTIYYHDQQRRLYMTGGKTKYQVLGNAGFFNDGNSQRVAAMSMVIPRYHHGMAELNGVIYVVGGVTEGGLTQQVEMYDSAEDRWIGVTPLSQKKSHVSVASLNGHLYCVGGYSGYRSLATVERLDPDTNQWTVIQPLPSPRYNACISINRYLYVIGGSVHWWTARNWARYDQKLGIWSSKRINMSMNNKEHVAFIWRNSMYCLSLTHSLLFLLNQDSSNVKKWKMSGLEHEQEEQAHYIIGCSYK